MKIENIEKLLRLHCSDDELRPHMQKPYRQDDFFFGVNGITLVQVPINLVPNLAFEINEKAPDCMKVMPANRHEALLFNIPKLIALIETAPKIPLRIDCENCGGEGFEECNLGHDHECEECGGDGFHEHADKMVPNPDQVFVIYEIAFRVQVLDLLIKSASLIGCENVSMVWSKPESPCVFELGEIRMLICPAKQIKNSDDIPDYIIVPEPLNSEL